MQARVSEIRRADCTAQAVLVGARTVDTLMRYSDGTWRAMSRSGLKMFPERSRLPNATLAAMNKEAPPELTVELAPA